MCGIFGFVGGPDSGLLGRMGSVLLHRGPDDGGFAEFPWVSLGHRRLSIIDIVGGHQPIANEDETVWLAFNGEVYNFRELRGELLERGHTLRTNSDSEVIVHAYEEWGPDCFGRFNGMWALALVDLRKNMVVLARDHFGIKPLYYARSRGRLLFASEIKALLQDPALPARPNDQIVYEYLAHGLHDHRAETFFEGVYHLMPATFMEIRLDPAEEIERGASQPRDGVGPRPFRETTTRYWTPQLSVDRTTTPEDFARVFRQAVARRLVADVPVGACLSGGLDSTPVVGVMAELLKEEAPDAESMRGRLKTFSAVFDNDPIDERAYISTVVEATGADTTYIKPLSETFVDELRDFIWHQDEPLVSTGPYAQWCVMREARKQVTVVLDGQGGDELLAGYTPYYFVYLRQLWKERKLTVLARELWVGRNTWMPFLRRRLRARRRQLSIRGLLQPAFLARVQQPGYGRSRDDLKLRLLQDVTTYSLPAVLRYEDKNSMAHSLESRVPFLDQELVEFILHLPPEAIIRNGFSRFIVRQGLRAVIPEKVRLRRSKIGFTTPEMRWIKVRRAAFLSLYRSTSFQSRPYWKGEDVVREFQATCQGRVEESFFFWRAANVELWLREFIDARRDATGPTATASAGAVAAPQKATPAPPVDMSTLTESGPVGAQHRGAVADLGDLLAVGIAASGEAARVARTYAPNPGKHLFVTVGGSTYARLPIRTEIIVRGDDYESLLQRFVQPHCRPGDTIVVAEKPLAVSQGRSYSIDEIKVSWLARLLVKGVTRTPHGIGISSKWTMQLAINEAGVPRILLATAVAAAGRLFGVRGLFYRVAGPVVEAIDGPAHYVIPPYDKHASLGPADPAGVAERLAAFVGNGVGVAVVDACDLSVHVMGHSPGVDAALVKELMRDNPLGAGSEQTPIAILRNVGEAEPPGAAWQEPKLEGAASLQEA